MIKLNEKKLKKKINWVWQLWTEILKRQRKEEINT